MKFVEVGRLRDGFAGREGFSLSEAVSAHTLPAIDMHQRKVVRDLSFSIL
jgi:hypothetical protein